MLSLLERVGRQIELRLAGPLDEPVRRNMYVELWVSIAYGAFFAASISFIPVVLRRMGASPDLLAVYTSQQFLGSSLASLSIIVMRRRRTMNVVVACWLLGRATLLLWAFVTQTGWMIVLSAIFWLLEAFPAPGYTRILIKLYPPDARGKIMSLVRMGRVGAILLITPVAGWALDLWGYRLLFPLAGLVGILSALHFLRLRVDEGQLPARQTKALRDLFGILRQDRRFARFLLSFSVYGAGTLLSWTLYPLVQVDRLHLTYSQIGLLGLAQSVVWLLGFLYWGRQVDQRGGLWVLRMNTLINLIIPLAYYFAQSPWMLLPAFIANGITIAGWDMGAINATIQLADEERVTEYAALQSTMLGLRGMFFPFVASGLLRVGVSINHIFLISLVLIGLSWWLFGTVQQVAPTPEQMANQRRLRYQWPLRWRFPRM
ncbi:MAG: MFS transporter [Caldilineaceae bacterium]|nr:MFS transporter [Caldilineaceae bacterium]HRJ44794.1 MFS transporter [Caldilineaceae bacterium]